MSDRPMADNDAAVEAAIRERQADDYEEASKGIALAAPLLMLKDVRTLLTLCDSLRAERDWMKHQTENLQEELRTTAAELIAMGAERDSLQARLTKLESRWDANVAEARAYMENDVALCNERDSLREALEKIYRDNEAACGCECDTDTCCNRVGEPCSKCEARAALAKGEK